MGKKGKGGKGKGGGKKQKKGGEAEARRRAEAVDDIESEEYKTNLMLELDEIMRESEIENKFASLYQQERERINYFWIAEKKHLEESQADLRNKEWSSQELKEKHDIEINVCKNRVKHLLFHNLDNLIESKTKAEITLKNSEDEHRYKQRDLKYDVRALKVTHKEKEVNHEDYMRSVKKDEDKKKMELRAEFERRAFEMKDRYTEKMNRLRTDMEEKKKRIIEQIEAKMNSDIKKLTHEHQQKLTDIQNYYKNITDSNISHIKQLQEEVHKLRKIEVSNLKTLNKLKFENKHFVNPLKETENLVELKKKEYDQYMKDKEELHNTFDRITQVEEEIRRWTWEYEVLLQQYDYLTRERDGVYKRFQDSILEVQQKVGLKNLILEKQLETIQETLEAKDIQLHQVISAANLSPETLAQVSSSLEDVETAKNEQINLIQAELKKIREAHNNMVKTYEGKLFEFGIPVEELGFDPLVPANI